MRISRSIVPRMFRPLFTTQSDQSSLSASLSSSRLPTGSASSIVMLLLYWKIYVSCADRTHIGGQP